jgi:hypothetical protein
MREFYASYTAWIFFSEDLETEQETQKPEFHRFY